MGILFEIFGYIGTALVIISMMMSSVTKLRIINISGSIISATYAGISSAWPIFVMNICLIIINVFHLIKHYTKKNEMTHYLVNSSDNGYLHFMTLHKNDIIKFNSLFNFEFNDSTSIYLLYNQCDIAGIVVGSQINNHFDLDLIYVVPKYRDASNDQILSAIFKDSKIAYVTSNINNNKSYNLFLGKLGFKKDKNYYIKNIH